jgi:hypothetical protein
MQKPLFSALYFITLTTAVMTIHQAFAERNPAVEPLTEISLDDSIPKKNNAGFDFHKHEVAAYTTDSRRIPANIATKTSQSSTPYSYIGPMIFLLALPAALWIVITKKMKNGDSSSKIDYFSKTHQFKPYKADIHSRDVEEDDQDYPKAS